MGSLEIEIQPPQLKHKTMFLRLTSQQFQHPNNNTMRKRRCSESFGENKFLNKKVRFDEYKNDCYNTLFFIELPNFLKIINEAIILDCRLWKEFSRKKIRNSLHLQCHDKITKNRLISNKLSVKDLLSCEDAKRKIDATKNETLIVLYDDCTNDETELLNENPLKIVLENIRKTLKNVNCKILRGK